MSFDCKDESCMSIYILMQVQSTIADTVLNQVSLHVCINMVCLLVNSALIYSRKEGNMIK
jgi:hypothetical protein